MLVYLLFFSPQDFAANQTSIYAIVFSSTTQKSGSIKGNIFHLISELCDLSKTPFQLHFGQLNRGLMAPSYPIHPWGVEEEMAR